MQHIQGKHVLEQMCINRAVGGFELLNVMIHFMKSLGKIPVITYIKQIFTSPNLFKIANDLRPMRLANARSSMIELHET